MVERKKYPLLNIRLSSENLKTLNLLGILDEKTGKQKPDNKINMSKLINRLISEHFSKVFDNDTARLEKNRLKSKLLAEQIAEANSELETIRNENEQIRNRLKKNSPKTYVSYTEVEDSDYKESWLND